MQFNSLEFFVFLVVVLVLINSLRKARYQQAVLLVGSYLFYYATSGPFVLLLLFITLVAFGAGDALARVADPRRRKAVLALALAALLLPLAFYKYYNFGVEILGQLPLPLAYYLNLPALELLLPVGISFFTFSAISYVVDVYRGTLAPERGLSRFALFISYFPHLLAGPIVRGGQFLPQLRDRVSLDGAALRAGATLMLWGFLKKFVIADNSAPFVDAIFADPVGLSSPYIVAGALLFGVQIYCDFSGYVDIALGTAALVGLHLPENFRRPYLARSPGDFWRRWNITLSSFIRDYVYIPLGGNRRGEGRTYLNLMAAMLVSGLWHGAAWNFVVWGGYHGLLQAVQRFGRTRLGIAGPSPEQGSLGILVQILVTQYFIFLGWIMFRVGDLSEMLYCVRKYVLFDFDFATPSPTHIRGVSTAIEAIGGTDPVVLVLGLAVAVAALVLLARSRRAADAVTALLSTDWPGRVASLRPRYWNLYVACAVFTLLTLPPSASPVFIYYQF